MTEQQKTNNVIVDHFSNRPIALSLENNEDKNGSDHHSKEERRATSVAERLSR